MGSIQLKDVRKAFGAVSVINGVNLNISDGEFAVFVGPHPLMGVDAAFMLLHHGTA